MDKDSEDEEEGDNGKLVGLRRWWRELRPFQRLILARVVPLAVNWVQGLHTIIAKREAAKKQEAILPVHPFF